MQCNTAGEEGRPTLYQYVFNNQTYITSHNTEGDRRRIMQGEQENVPYNESQIANQL